jgi:uncharacterized protein (TIGR02271 family)
MTDKQQQCTIVAVFDRYDAGRAAARDLIEMGVPREDVQVQSNLATGAVGSGGHGIQRAEHEGGVRGFFHRLFGGHEHRDEYVETVRRGSTVVVVTVPQESRDRVTEVLNQHDPIDIDRRVASYREQGWNSYNPGAPAYTQEEADLERKRFAESGEGPTIPVVQEELVVGKRPVRRGGVRVYTQVVEETAEEPVTLREEHVRVHRRPVDREVTPDEAARLKEQSIEVVETAEEPVVSKRIRVKEEVIVGKEVTSRTERVKDKVRRTKVNVEEIPEPDNAAAREREP